MDGTRFDHLTRRYVSTRARLGLVKGLLGVVLGERLGRSATRRSAVATGELVFCDDFEEGNLDKWDVVEGIAVYCPESISAPSCTASASGVGTSAAYARVALNEVLEGIYARLQFNMVLGGAWGTLLEVRTADDRPILGLRVGEQGELGLRNEVAGLESKSTVLVERWKWHEAQIYLRIDSSDQSRGEVEVWYDGKRVDDLSGIADLGSEPIGRLQLGWADGSGRYAFNDLVVASGPVDIEGCPREPVANNCPAEEMPLPDGCCPSERVFVDSFKCPGELCGGNLCCLTGRCDRGECLGGDNEKLSALAAIGRVDLVCCPAGALCGDQCCESWEVCVGGVDCCPRGAPVCEDGTCCPGPNLECACGTCRRKLRACDDCCDRLCVDDTCCPDDSIVEGLCCSSGEALDGECITMDSLPTTGAARIQRYRAL